MESLDWSDESENWTTRSGDWSFINRSLWRPGNSAIDFTKWNQAQTPTIRKIYILGSAHVLRVACPEIKILLHEESTEIWIVLILGRMFAQCFYQFWIDEILDQSIYAALPKEKKLWVSNVVLGSEGCDVEEINQIADFVGKVLEEYLIENSERLMKRAADEIEKNFLGG